MLSTAQILNPLTQIGHGRPFPLTEPDKGKAEMGFVETQLQLHKAEERRVCAELGQKPNNQDTAAGVALRVQRTFQLMA